MKHQNTYFIVKEYLYLLAAVLISILLMFSNESSFLKYLRVSGLDTFSIIRLDIFNFKKNSTLKEENTYLKERVIALTARNNSFKEATVENERLRKLLDIKQEAGYSYLYGRVVGVKPDNRKDLILVNIGSNSGVKVDDPVLSINGLVGKVVDCGGELSRVQLISHHSNKIPALTARNRIPGIIHPLDLTTADLKEITKTRDVVEGEEVITSRYSTIYPEGIKIGTVSFVSDSSATIHKLVKITFAEDLAKLEDVFVLTAADSLSGEESSVAGEEDAEEQN